MKAVLVIGIIVLFAFSQYNIFHISSNEDLSKNQSVDSIFVLKKLNYEIKINGNNALLNFLESMHAYESSTGKIWYVVNGLCISSLEGGLYISNTTIPVIFNRFSITPGVENSRVGIFLDNVSNIKIENLEVSTGNNEREFMGMYIMDSKNISIKNYKFRDWNEMNSALWVMNSTQIYIKNVNIWHSRGMGMFIKNSDHISIYGIFSILSEIAIVNSSNITFSNAKIYGAGLLIVFSDRCIVSNTTFLQGYTGVWSIGSNKNIIENNIFAYNDKSIIMAGINSPTWGNIIRNNVFAYSNYGIYLSADCSNRIYGNIFLNAQGYDNGYERSITWNYSCVQYSFWNNSHIGNYWNLWANKNDSNDINNDGIVDYPFNISGSPYAVDYYPLKHLPFRYSLPPSSPRNLSVEVRGSRAYLKWQMPKFLSSSVKEYKIYKNGELIAIVKGNELRYVDHLKESGPTIYNVVAVGKNNETSMTSNFVEVKYTSLNYLFYSEVVILIPIIFIIVYFLYKKYK